MSQLTIKEILNTKIPQVIFDFSTLVSSITYLTMCEQLSDIWITKGMDPKLDLLFFTSAIRSNMFKLLEKKYKSHPTNHKFNHIEQLKIISGIGFNRPKPILKQADLVHNFPFINDSKIFSM